MNTAQEVRPGDIMFARHLRPRSVEMLVRAGQWTLGETGYPQHVAVVVQAAGPPPWPEPARIVQAMPSGAEEIALTPEHFTKDYVYVRPAYAVGEPFRIGYEYRSQGFKVAHAARTYVGTPYSFLDYAAIAGLHLGVENGPIRRYVTTTGHMICSQLADQAMSDAGFHVFDDGRLPQDVVPSALYRQLLSLSGQRCTGDGGGWIKNG